MRGIALILAAGKGSRMRSKTIKILHPILGRPMVMWPVTAARKAGLEPWLVVGHQESIVKRSLTDSDLKFVKQPEAKGTGHATLCAMDALPENGVLVVMCGDTPLLKGETLKALIQAHGDNLATVLSVNVQDPAAYGRIVRDAAGRVLKIVEASEATPEELAITEINAGAYVFNLSWLRAQLPSFKEHPPKNEIYLTDALERAAAKGRAGALTLKDPIECSGVNDRWALAEATAALQERILKEHAANGVGMEDPKSISIDVDVRLGQDVFLEKGVSLRGKVTLEEDVNIGAHSVLIDTRVETRTNILPMCHLQGCRVGADASVGPFARLREGTVIESKVKIGNFVETKKSVFEEGSKASHLSYIGDCQVGSNANIGAGTITCNYDGFDKHKTHIGSGAFIGSNTALVAPVSIGAGAIVGAGSTISQNVSKDAIVVERAKPTVRENGAKRFRSKRNQ